MEKNNKNKKEEIDVRGEKETKEKQESVQFCVMAQTMLA